MYCQCKRTYETGKQLRLENARKYKKAKLIVKTQNEKKIRLENDRVYHRNKRLKQSTTEICSSCIENAKHHEGTMSQTYTNKIMNQLDYLKDFDINNGFIHEQSWARSNMSKFHKFNQFVVSHCTIC